MSTGRGVLSTDGKPARCRRFGERADAMPTRVAECLRGASPLEGVSKTDIIRCLKRYLAREVHRTLRADLEDLHGA